MSLDTTSHYLLSLISVLDSYGAKEWDLRAVGATSAAVFLGIRIQIGHKHGIDWDAWLHAIISGVGSLVCIYLNIYAAEIINDGISEPFGSIACNGALTSFHRIIPAITQGYAICDIINGFKLGPAFLAHGLATFSVMTIFNELGASHIMTPILIMEVSTIVLAVLRADFFSPTVQLITQAAFAILFFLSRIVASPIILYGIITTMNENLGDCFPRSLFYFTLGFGVFFTLLNTFWFVKIVKKIQRKLSGAESLKNLQKE